MASHDAPLWREAIDDEMHSIMSNNTWILSDLILDVSLLVVDGSLERN